MGNLETFQKIGETGTKAFDKMDDNEKKEGFNNLIEEIDGCDSINRLKEKRNSLTEDQKLKLYKMDAISISGYIKNYPLYRIYSSIVNGTKNTLKNGGKNAIIYGFLEHIPCRFFIELGILNKPKGLEKETLIKDTQKDAKNFNRYLSICKTICACIPEAKPAIPFIQMAKHYTKRYEKHGTEVLTARLSKQQEDNIKKHTQEELFDIMPHSTSSIENK